jgi:hypothetical protein
MNSVTWNTSTTPSSTACNTTGIDCKTIIANSAAQEEALESYRSRFETMQAMLVTAVTMDEQYISVSKVATVLEIPLPTFVHRAVTVVVSLTLPPGFDEDDLDNARLFHSPSIQLTERMHLQGIQIEDCDIDSVRPFDPNNID